MRVSESWACAGAELSRRGVDDPTLEAEVLVRHVLGLSRAQLFSTLNDGVTVEHRREIDQVVERRSGGEPLAYIRGFREFYGLDFMVNPHVLVPRQETETLVDLVLEASSRSRREELQVADVGTGSGAIAVAVAANLPLARVFATDASPDALRVADANRRRHRVSDRVRLLLGDLLDPVPSPVDVIVSNPPYIRRGDLDGLPDSVRREPAMALDGGSDGLGPTIRLIRTAPPLLNPGGVLIVEIDPEQLEPVSGYAQSQFPSGQVEYRCDLLGMPRAVVVRLP